MKFTKHEILTKLWEHLLSLQKGFAFSRQKKRVTFADGDFCFLDLEMYHIELRSVVLINVRAGDPKAADIEQMQRLVEHYNKREVYPNENPTIGIVINKMKNACHITYIGATEEQKQIAASALALDEFIAESKRATGKTCGNCKWGAKGDGKALHEDDTVCVNDKSERLADFVSRSDTCRLWEPNEK
ncbi:hypothetical protein FACS1894211_06730 [Clostridia bacterium]|nr:hypothetical protein FACS1894211_06730 [Clostridia bacterium]